MKKTAFLVVILSLIILSGCTEINNLTKHTEKCNPRAECCSDADCVKNTSGGNNIGMVIYPPCYKGKCENPKNTNEWIEYCDVAGNDARSLYIWNCYMNAAYDALKKSSPLKDYTIIWDDAFKVCDKYTPDKSEQCKLDVCQNLHLGDGNMKYSYPEVEQCNEEAIKNSSCFDKVKNGRESDIDCGGSNCYSCKTGMSCKENEDCETQACNVGGFHPDYKCVEKCPNGKILDNIPCFCANSMRYKDTEENWQKEYGHLHNNQPSYCCSDKIQWTPCE